MSDKEPVEDLLASNRPDATEYAVYIGSALFVAPLPLYVFLFIRGLSLSDSLNLPIFALVTLFTVGVLVFSYVNSTQSKKVSIERQKKSRPSAGAGVGSASGLSKKDRKELNQANLEKERSAVASEALSFAIGLNNTLFLVFFYFFQLILPFPALYDYIFSVTLAGAGLAFITTPRK